MIPVIGANCLLKNTDLAGFSHYYGISTSFWPLMMKRSDYGMVFAVTLKKTITIYGKEK